MNRVDSTIATADSIIARAEQKKAKADLAEAQMLRSHFDEQIAESRRRAPRCENENSKDGCCDGEAADVCVYCELSLCYTGGCFDDVCASPTSPDGKHLPSKKAIEVAVEKLATKMRMVG